MTNALIWQLMTVVTLLYISVTAFLAWKTFRPRARVILAILIAASALIAWLFSLTWKSLPGFQAWFLDPNSEYALGSVLGTALLLGIGLVALSLFRGAKRNDQRAYWLFVGLTLILMSFDEYYALHEPYLWATGAYVIAGALIALIPCIFWLRDRSDWLWLMIPLGFWGMAFGGVFWDYLIVEVICYDPNLGTACHKLFVIEEGFEFLGEGVILAGLIAFAQRDLPPTQNRRRLPAIIIGLVGTVTLAMFFGTWILPGIEARSADPVQATYLAYNGTEGETLSLIGYKVNTDRIAPGDEVEVITYWRADSSLRHDYGISAHLLAYPDVDSLSGDDVLLGHILSSGWLPGVIVKQRLTLTVPDDLDTPRSYWLSVTVWDKDTDDKNPSIVQTDRQTINPNAFILVHLAAPTSDPPPSPPQVSAYQFEEGFRLSGYGLPDTLRTGDSAELSFWWEVETRTLSDLNQFIHLIPLDGDTEDFIGFDRPPFGGVFPTNDWVGGVLMMDQWEVITPADAPAGVYEVYTGLYSWVTGVRQALRDAEGNPLPDNRIYLGDVTIE